MPPTAPSVPTFQAEEPGLASAVGEALGLTGCAIVRGVAVDDDAHLLDVVGLLARPSSVGNGGGLIHEVAPRPEAEQADLSTTRAPFPLHTDSTFLAEPHDLIALGCVQAPADGGGTSMVLGVDAARERIAEAAGTAVLERLEQPAFPFVLQLPGLQPNVRLLPILQLVDGGWTVRYREDAIARLRSAGVELDADHVAALHAFEEALSVPGLALSHDLRPGEVLLVDNRRMLHGRTTIRAGAQRRLRRVKAFTGKTTSV